MKKTAILICLIFLVMTPVFAADYNDGHTEKGVWGRLASVEGRGLANLIGLPFEFPRTILQEARWHQRLWPVTFSFRLVYHVIIRAVSGVNDIAIYPWAVPLTDDISPVTEPFGLPDYPWQMNA